jgi:hypothetical protein
MKTQPGMKLPPIPFKAVITSGGRTIETTIVGHSRYGYHTRGCGIVPAEAITPIAVSTWHVSNDPLADYERLKQPLSFATSDKPVFDADEWRSRKPKTERDFWKDRRDRTRAWLRDLLKDGPLPAAHILRSAKKDDIPERGLRRAKRRLGILAYKRGGDHGRNGARWFWAAHRQTQPIDQAKTAEDE